jgi:hypothetical protein
VAGHGLGVNVLIGKSKILLGIVMTFIHFLRGWRSLTLGL